jgi:hypothetical protein
MTTISPNAQRIRRPAGAVARLRALAAVAMLSAGWVSAAQAQPQEIAVAADETYVQAASGMVFPPRAGAFHRVHVLRFDDAERDVAAGYNFVLGDNRIVATVYVYPTPALGAIGASAEEDAGERSQVMMEEMFARKQEVSQFHPETKILTEDFATLDQAGVRYSGLRAHFSFEDKFAGRQRRLLSDLFLYGFVGGQWFVKYRFTYPAELDAERRIGEFMQALIVTIPPES